MSGTQKDSPETTTPATSQGAKQGLLEAVFRPVNIKALAIYFRSFSVLLGSGMGMAEATNSLSKTTSNQTLREVTDRVDGAARDGRPISSALEKYPAVFPPFVMAMIRSGESTGMMEDMMRRLAEYYDQEYELRMLYRFETFYPKVLLVAFLVIPCLPQLVLEGWMAFLKAAIVRSLPWLIVIGAAWLVWRLLLQSPEFRQGFDRFKLALPWIGSIVKRTAVAKWARTMALLYSAGVALGAAWEACASSVGNEAMARNIRGKTSALRSGVPLSQAMASTREFPDMAVQLVATGERSGDIGQMLNKTAQFYESEAGTAGRQLAVLTGVVVYLMVALMIAGYIIGAYRGMYSD